jgi:glycosyltransferase involved in cell wall biosynthesis
VEPLVSVIVPTFNRCASLGRLLEALAHQTYPAHQFEVVVVDDGSTDGTAQRLRELAPPYQLSVLTQINQGPAAARNLGVEHARGSLIVFLDDDVVPLPELIAEHVATHDAGGDPVVLGPMSPPQDWPRPSWIRWEEEHLQEQYHALLTGKYACTPRQFFSANASLSRARFLEAGGFDPAFRRAEDLEFAFRLRDRGASFVFSARADVLHYASRSFESWCSIPYQYGRYEVAMQRDKGHESFRCATTEFHYRHPFIRLLVRGCIGRPKLTRATIGALRGSVHTVERIGARGPAALLLSGLFNLLYWQGVSDELGGADLVWRSIAAGAGAAATP